MPTATSVPARATSSSPAHRGVLVTTCLGLMTVVSAVASLNVALPSIAEQTRADQTQLSWIVDAYSLVFAALLLPAGALGDRLGRRRALVAGLAVFGAASGAAMAVDSPTTLIALRALLGVGAALVMPATLSTVTSTFPAEQRARAVGTWSGVAGGSAVFGLLTSGLVLEQWSWRAVFAVNVVLAVVALAATVRFVPESADPDAPRIDLVGAVLVVAGLGVLVWAIIEAPTRGWTSATTLGSLAVALCVVAAFVVWPLRSSDPLLDPRLFGNRAFAAGVSSVSLQFLAFFGFLFLILQYLQLLLGDSPLVAAVSLLPMAAGMLSGARVLAVRLVVRLGTARTSLLGLLVAAGGLALLSRLDATTPYWVLLCGLVPLGLGMGLAMTPATTSITDALPADRQGTASALNDLARELGGALGIAILGSVLQSVFGGRLPVAPALALRDPRIRSVAEDAFTDGLRDALLVGCGALVLAAAIVVALRGRRAN